MSGYDLAAIVCVIFGVFGASAAVAGSLERVAHAIARRKADYPEGMSAEYWMRACKSAERQATEFRERILKLEMDAEELNAENDRLRRSVAERAPCPECRGTP